MQKQVPKPAMKSLTCMFKFMLCYAKLNQPHPHGLTSCFKIKHEFDINLPQPGISPKMLSSYFDVLWRQ